MTEDDVRRIVREEIVNALRALAREADEQDSYETQELDSRALGNIVKAAEGAVVRVLCVHEEYRDGWPGRPARCSRCVEPQPEPVNPFEEKS